MEKQHQHHRGSWGSSLGFLMAAIGSAVGLGNLWGFPFKMGANGGFAFLLVYIVLTVAVGFAMLMAEMAIGRKTGRSAVGAFRQLDSRHPEVGYMGVISGTIVVSYYCVLGGLCLRYCLGFFTEMFGGTGFLGHGEEFFQTFTASPWSMVLCTAAFAVITGSILMGGVSGGIEKFSTVAMPALFVMLIALVVYISRQPGAEQGYAFMFTPDWDYLKENFFSVVSTAAGQMFFSLSLAMGIMVAYGSYLKKDENIPRDALLICGADTIIALLAGCLVIPAAFAFVGEDAYMSGVKLLFVTMHQVFFNIDGRFGCFLGFIFFLTVSIAAITSSVSLLEVSVSFGVDRRIDKHKAPRRKTIIAVCTILVFLLAVPVALDALGGAAGATPLGLLQQLFPALALKGWNESFINAYSFISEGFLMPLGALLMSLYIGYKYKTTLITNECGIRRGRVLDLCYRFIVPIAMLVVLYGQLRDFLG